MFLNTAMKAEDCIDTGALGQKKRICVIGAGPAGLGALKIIADAPQYKAGLWEPVAFESRTGLGGVWLPVPTGGDPSTTPMYDSLTTNIPHPIMAYRSFPFPPGTPLYPPALVVIQYLTSYAEHFDIAKHVKLNTTVRLVDWDASLSQWRVHVSPVDASSDHPTEESLFDLVIVANGHYNKPYYPRTPGLSSWLECGKAVHSASYKRPQYVGDTVLVIGAGPSGQDVAAEMSTVSKTVVHSYTSSYGNRTQNMRDKIRHRPPIVEFLDPEQGTVLFEDGTTATGIDHCILATGYEHSLPFLPPSLLEHGFPSSALPIPARLYNSGSGLFPLARQLFPLTTAFPPARMAFLSLPYYTAPLRFAEAQTIAALRAFADPRALDATREAAAVAARWAQLHAETGGDARAVARLWHKMEVEQFGYRDEMHVFAGGEYARPEYMVPGWEVEVWKNRDVLRAEWIELVRIGEADRWVKSVGRAGGKEGEMEWVRVMGRVIQRGLERRSAQASSKPLQLSRL